MFLIGNNCSNKNGQIKYSTSFITTFRLRLYYLCLGKFGAMRWDYFDVHQVFLLKLNIK